MATPIISERGRRTPPSPIRKMAPLANAAKLKGLKVYHLNIGQPDIRAPQEFFAGLASYREEVVAYEAARGSEGLCRAWSAFMEKTTGIKTDPAQYVITFGGSEALLYTIMAVADPGDEIVIFDPSYANYLGFTEMAAVKPVAVQTRIEDGFALPERRIIEQAISARTRAILLCSPNNPTGGVYSRAELQMVLDLCNERGLFLIADEAYREFVYDGVEALSILHLDAANPRVVLCDTLSKRFSLCGARVGCAYTTNVELFGAIYRMAQARLSASAIEQVAATHLLQTVDPTFISKVVREYQHRRDVLFEGLRGIPGVTAVRPQGAFYTIAAFPVKNAEAFASFMLRDFSLEGETVFTAPGSGFYVDGKEGERQLRLAYVLESPVLARALEILAAGLKEYRD